MMDFTPLTAADRTEPYVPPQTLRDRGWRQMKKNRLALWGLAIVVVMSLLAIAGPWLAPYTYADQDLTAANAWPSAAHWFGTDSLGRDLFVRVLYGARISLSIGLVASLINVFTSRSVSPEKAVESFVEDDALHVTVHLAVFYGYPFTKLADDVRAEVARAVTEQIGVSVSAVDVCIDSLVFPKE